MTLIEIACILDAKIIEMMNIHGKPVERWKAISELVNRKESPLYRQGDSDVWKACDLLVSTGWYKLLFNEESSLPDLVPNVDRNGVVR